MRKNVAFLILVLMISLSCVREQGGPKIEKWDFFELSLPGPSEGNPYKETTFNVVFSKGDVTKIIPGFYDGAGIYMVRFMPEETGTWNYTTQSNIEELDGVTGSFVCVENSESNRGPVEVFNTYYLRYADKTPYYQVGTTCYAWIHQGDSLENITLETLAQSPFNKLRMCVFPKDYVYNENEPVYYPFERDSLGDHDFERFNPAFWHHLEKRVLQLRELGIEADIILFHSYDRWGYANMPDSLDDYYLKYVLARLSAFRHVWWSMANEYDFMEFKTMADWHRLFQIVYENDPYGHLRSIHNGREWYDHANPWVTHASIQSTHFDSAAVWRERFKKPLIYDECRYEGNIIQGWGNITPEQMTAMFWRSLITGTYAGHGETYKHPRDILWWAKGGVLHGKSPKRIQFFKKYLEEMPETGFQVFDTYSAGIHGEYYIFYFDEETPEKWTFNLPGERIYKVEIIDTWNMTSVVKKENYTSPFTIELPGKEYMAVKIIVDDVIFPVGKVDLEAMGLNFNEENSKVLFTGTAELKFIHHASEEIRYNMSDETVTRQSPLYQEPFTITTETKIRVAAYEGERKGKEITYHLVPVDLKPSLEPENPQPGLKYTYYEGEWTRVPDFKKMEPIREGTIEYPHLKVEHREDYFGLFFNGLIKVPYDGLYTFYVVSDDGAFIIIDGEKIVDNDGQHGMREASGQVALQAGYHTIEIPYFDNQYDHGLEVYYFHQETGKKSLSKDMLFHLK